MYDIFEHLLQTHGVTAYKVAKDTGISTATMTDWKKGRSTPKIDKLQKIADYFGVSVDYLLGGEPKEKIPASGGERASDDDIKFALFGGDGEITDEMYEEVKKFAQFIKQKEREKGNDKPV